MIGALVAILSLNVSLTLMTDYSVIAGTLPITAATATTPIVVTSPAHGWALERRIHGIVSGVVGTVEANGLWELTPLDADTFALATYTAQGLPSPSVGVHAYVSGGQIQWAFPDGRILLGRRNKLLSTQVATPRIVMIPTRGRAWGFEAYGGAAPNIGPASVPNVRGSDEQQSMSLGPQLATEFPTFEIYVNGSAPNYGAAATDPDFGDFDATQAIVHALYSELFDATGGVPRAKILSEDWPSQSERGASMTQRGQQWMGVLEMQQPVRAKPGRFVPIGTSCSLVVQPENPGATDPITIAIPPA